MPTTDVSIPYRRVRTVRLLRRARFSTISQRDDERWRRRGIFGVRDRVPLSIMIFSWRTFSTEFTYYQLAPSVKTVEHSFFLRRSDCFRKSYSCTIPIPIHTEYYETFVCAKLVFHTSKFFLFFFFLLYSPTKCNLMFLNSYSKSSEP